VAAEGDASDEPADAADQGPHIVRLPSLRRLTRRALAHLIEAAVVPAVTFYVVMVCVNLRWAAIAGLGWAYLTMAVRLVRKKRVPGLVALSAVVFTARAAIAFATNSAFLYFLQPSLGTLCLAGLCAASITGRPLMHRLAEDFCTMPASLSAHPRIQRFFVRLTLLWSLLLTINAVGTILLLMHESVGMFLALRTVASYGLVGSGALASYLWFSRTIRGGNIRIVFGPHTAAASQSA